MMTQPRQTPAPQHPSPSPRQIAAGIGQATRQEICGMLAMQDAARISQIAAGLGDAARRKLASDAGPTVDRITALATGLLDGPVPTDALRARLWLTLKQALGLPGLYPLSRRGLESEAAAMAVRASQILAPSVAKVRQDRDDAGSSAVGRSGRNLLRAGSGARRRARDAVTFPDIVAHELAVTMEALAEADRRGELDPEVAAAIRNGQRAISTAALAGGGWAALATAIGGAGFAPYMAAAQLSAVIPFVAGPTLTSLLFVLINPVTVVAGTAALGYWAVKGQGTAARQVAAARAAVLLAVRGHDADDGADLLLDAFRSLHRMTDADLAHLTADQREDVRSHAVRVTKHIASDIPRTPTGAPGLWGVPIIGSGDTRAQDAALVGGLTAGDMLYHAAAVDPSVLAAADFSRVGDFDTPLDLAAHLSDFALQGARISLRGYSAEQLVMAQLIEQGHDVTLAEGPTTAGHDLIVDGSPVQVKCGTSLSLLRDHFAVYPDIPVIADAALAAQAQASGQDWAHLVTTTDGFDLDHVQSLVDRTLQAAADLGEVPVPIYAVAIGAARAAHRTWTGQIPVEDLPAWLVIDLSIRGGLATAGQAGGAALGLLVMGPAGALILGPIIGVGALLGTGKAHDLLDQGIRGEWHAEVLEAAGQLRIALLQARHRQIDALTRRLAKLRQANTTLPLHLIVWLEGRMADDLIATIEAKGQIPTATDLPSAMELMVEASAPDMIDPDVLRARHHLARRIAAKPTTTDALRELGTKAKDAVKGRVMEKPR